ncbi:hypothetical protein SLS60_000777 [Paraconiothyrium brasiliense]|uniref:Uncharacterized protein n=1 Tax=Paraconiothyrium brasiliense TaxID=300254 RepID=A0ABR3S779_9PLEO
MPGIAKKLGASYHHNYQSRKFSESAALLTHLREYGLRVQWKRAPKPPFERIILHDFTLLKPTGQRPLPGLRYTINGQPSCRIYHLERLTNAITNKTITHYMLSLQGYATNLPFEWKDPSEFSKTGFSTTIQRAQMLYAFDDEDIDLSDMEGIVPFGDVVSVPFEFAISSLDGSREFCSLVDYGVSFHEMVQTLSDAAVQEGKGFNSKHMRAILRNCYHGKQRTYGMRPSEIKQELKNRGFRKGGLVVSWGSSHLDFYAVARMFKGIDRIIVKRNELLPERFKRLSLDQLLRRTSNLRTTKLKAVYTVMANEIKPVTAWHSASEDTRALRPIAKRTRSELVKLLGDLGFFNSNFWANPVWAADDRGEMEEDEEALAQEESNDIIQDTLDVESEDEVETSMEEESLPDLADSEESDTDEESEEEGSELDGESEEEASDSGEESGGENSESDGEGEDGGEEEGHYEPYQRNRKRE